MSTPAPDPDYDLISLLPAGQEMTRDRYDALAAAYAANNYQPLSEAQIVAAVGPALPPPNSPPWPWCDA